MSQYQNLTEVLEDKVKQRIERGIENSKPLLERIEREGNLLKDMLVPLGSNNQLQFDTYTKNEIPKVGVLIQNGGAHSFSLHPHAVFQAGEKLEMPATWLRNLAESGSDWKVRLAVEALNTYSDHTPRQRVLVRAIDTEIRGVLSDRYRRLNTPDIFGMFIKSAYKAGALLYDVMVSDTRVAIEALIPNLLTIPTQKNGIQSMAFGFRISNSDFGDGALEFRMFMLSAHCLNGAVGESLIREIHLGKQISDNFNWSERTYKLDTAEKASKIRDLVDASAEPENLMLLSNKIQRASEIVVDLDKEFKELPKVGLLLEEVKEVKDVITNNRVEDGVQGENTLWKLVQGVGAVARNKDAQRKRELEEISGKLFERAKIKESLVLS